MSLVALLVFSTNSIAQEQQTASKDKTDMTERQQQIAVDIVSVHLDFSRKNSRATNYGDGRGIKQT